MKEELLEGSNAVLLGWPCRRCTARPFSTTARQAPLPMASTIPETPTTVRRSQATQAREPSKLRMQVDPNKPSNAANTNSSKPDTSAYQEYLKFLEDSCVIKLDQAQVERNLTKTGEKGLCMAMDSYINNPSGDMNRRFVTNYLTIIERLCSESMASDGTGFVPRTDDVAHLVEWSTIQQARFTLVAPEQGVPPLSLLDVITGLLSLLPAHLKGMRSIFEKHVRMYTGSLLCTLDLKRGFEGCLSTPHSLRAFTAKRNKSPELGDFAFLHFRKLRLPSDLAGIHTPWTHLDDCLKNSGSEPMDPGMLGRIKAFPMTPAEALSLAGLLKDGAPPVNGDEARELMNEFWRVGPKALPHPTLVPFIVSALAVPINYEENKEAIEEICAHLLFSARAGPGSNTIFFIQDTVACIQFGAFYTQILQHQRDLEDLRGTGALGNTTKAVPLIEDDMQAPQKDEGSQEKPIPSTDSSEEDEDAPPLSTAFADFAVID